MQMKLNNILLIVAFTLSVLMFREVNASVVTDGLVSWWKFDETSGTTAFDSYGSNDGTLVNFPATPAWTNETPGAASSGALYLNSDNNYIDCGSAFNSISNSMTAELWIKRRAITGSYDAFLSKYQDSNNRWYLRITSGNTMIAYGKKDGVSIFGGDLTSTQLIYSNVWHHIALTITPDSNCYWYVNGVQTGTKTLAVASIANTANLRIGIYGSEEINGLIDDVRIYDRALSPAEILQNYRAINGDTGLVTDNLVSWWKMDDGFGPRARDSWGGGSGLLVNFDAEPAWTNDTPGAASPCALKFDGVNDAINTGNKLSSVSNAVTTEIWIKHWPISDGDPWQVFLTKYQDYYNRWYLRYSSTSYLVGYGRSETNNIFNGGDFNSTGSVSYDAWHHIVLTSASDSNCCWYVDGELVGTGTRDNPLYNTGDLYIGSYYGIGNVAIDAVIDDVRVYDRALTAEEVFQNYRVIVPGPPKGTAILIQ